MGLEIRKVPKDWEHPVTPRGNRNPSELAYQPDTYFDGWHPVHDRDWLSAYREWLRNKLVWKIQAPIAWVLVLLGIVDINKQFAKSVRTNYEDWDGEKPDPFYFRPRWREKKRTHLQLYETVSEGTPLSPPMPDADSLAEWLAGKHVWIDTENMTKDDWMKFIDRGGFSVSMVLSPEHGIQTGLEAVISD